MCYRVQIKPIWFTNCRQYNTGQRDPIEFGTYVAYR